MYKGMMDDDTFFHYPWCTHHHHVYIYISGKYWDIYVYVCGGGCIRGCFGGGMSVVIHLQAPCDGLVCLSTTWAVFLTPKVVNMANYAILYGIPPSRVKSSSSSLSLAIIIPTCLLVAVKVAGDLRAL